MKIAVLLIALSFFQNLPPLARLQKAAATNTGVLTVTISNFKNDRGSAVVSLYNNSDGFPKSPDKALRKMTTRIFSGQAVADFAGLPAGEYAVAVYHDENDNKKLDTNLFGIPKEGVGNSNNAKGHFGPPKYADAKFTFNGGKQTISIKIVYL